MNIRNIIKEEVYDYLNNDKRNKEKEDNEIFNDKLFQKNFIIDSIENNKIKKYVNNENLHDFSRKYDDTNNNYIDAEINIGYEYIYNIPLKFNIDFKCNKLSISDGELNNEEDINNINWIDFNVVFNTTTGDKIDFLMFNNANDNIKKLFIKNNIKNILIETLL
jgi:hypothetical protein